jgi:hypothetical protein
MRTLLTDDSLSKHLSRMMTGNENSYAIISRDSFYESSTYPVEIIKCKAGSGEVIELFCKYLSGVDSNNNGHRGGVEYEADVYSKILRELPFPKINFYGICFIPEINEALMAIEFLGETLRMTYSEDPDVLIKASSWIGNFHRLNEGNTPEFLKRYTKSYYEIWLNNFNEWTNKYQVTYPWLKKLSDFYKTNSDILMDHSCTIIHGEYYPKNILIKNGIIYPVDWESAAFAPGEIDLASLTEGWDESDIIRAKEAYKNARWGSAFNDEAFEKRFLLSEIYIQFWSSEENSNIEIFPESETFSQLYFLVEKVSKLQ